MITAFLALAIWTVNITYDRPGEIHGVLKVCVSAHNRGSARTQGRRTARSELRSGIRIQDVDVTKGCRWMPDDLED